MVDDLVIACEEAFSDPSPACKDVGSAGLEPWICRLRLIILDDTVLVPGEVAPEGKEGLGSKLLVVFDVHVDTLVVHDTEVGIRHLDETAVVRNSSTLEEDSGTVLLEELYCEREFVLEELEVETEVLLEGC